MASSASIYCAHPERAGLPLGTCRFNLRQELDAAADRGRKRNLEDPERSRSHQLRPVLPGSQVVMFEEVQAGVDLWIDQDAGPSFCGQPLMRG